MKTDVTFLGNIIKVDSSSVEIEISDEIPSSAPIVNGKVYKIGQIGTFVKVPIGNISIYGIVSSVSNTPSNIKDEEVGYYKDSRFLSVQLIGEKIGKEKFQRGVGTYPTINDEVHIVTEEDLAEIYGSKENGSVEIGKHSSSEELPIFVDLHNLVLRHAAILGSTGSGKSNTTVGIIKSILEEYEGGRIVLVDPHGEYSSAFPEQAQVFKINDDENPLIIPYWLMTFDELAYFLVGATQNDENKPQYRMLREWITNYKKENSELKAGNINEVFITADSPIPFDIKKLWHKMNWWVNATFTTSMKMDQNENTACVEDPGNPEELIPARFKPYEVNNQEPYKSKHEEYIQYETKILNRIKDSRFNFLFSHEEYTGKEDDKDLHDLLNKWISNEKKLTILDLSGVPFELLDISVGLITRFLYDSMYWGRLEDYTGKKRPLLIAYEEAHSYLSDDGKGGYSRKAVEAVFKEGRKFGLGSLVISQRPSEISETILAQIGTYIALRLTNSKDKNIVKASAPDNLFSLIDLLPSLRIGESIVVGEAINIPSRVRIKLQHPRPESNDPDLVESWSRTHPVNGENYKRVVNALREQRLRADGNN